MKNVLSTVFSVVIIVLLVVLLSKGTPSASLKGFGDGVANFSTTTYAQTNNNMGVANLNTGAVLKLGQGVLDGVTLTGATTGILCLSNGTTTNHVNTATSSLICLGPSVAAGHYPVNAAFDLGLVFTFSGLMPTSTITWR